MNCFLSRLMQCAHVVVLLQPLTTEPPPHAKCKDKFLVQSAFITPDEEMRTLAEMVSPISIDKWV
jgi:hypothetical protein